LILNLLRSQITVQREKIINNKIRGVKMQKFTPLIGRIFLSAIFLMSGLGKIANFSGTHQYMAAYGMPMTSLFLIGAIILDV